MIAVTGATGFIGQGIVRAALAQGHSVTLLSRGNKAYQAQDLFGAHDPARLHWMQADLTDSHIDLDAVFGPQLSRCETLFHCAGELKDTKLMHALHVTGTARLIAAAQGRVRTWVQLSSVGAYGPDATGQITEATPEAPVGTYECTKTKADNLVRAASANKAFQARILRPAIVIGTQMPNDAIRHMIAALAQRRFAYIGAKPALTNYIAVENLVAALIAAPTAKAGPCEVYNLAQTCPLSSFIEALCHGLDITAPTRRIPLGFAQSVAYLGKLIPGFPLTLSRIRALSSQTCYQSDKLEQTSAYTPEVNILKTAEQMARIWYRTTHNACSASTGHPHGS